MDDAKSVAPVRRRWPYVAMAGAVGTLVVIGFLTQAQGGGQPRNCDALVPDIIALSREDGSGVGILSVGRVTEHSKTSDSLVCRGRARWDDDDSTGIEFYQERHSDGEWYIGYRGLLQ